METQFLKSEIKDIATKLSEIDKKVAIIEYKIQYFEDKFKNHENSVNQIKERGLTKLIGKHWVNIPTIGTILFAIIWLGNWLYDLPSPEQEKELQKLLESKKYNDNQKK